MRIKCLLYVLIFIPILVLGQGNNKKDYISIRFVPDNSNWTYNIGDKPYLEVSVEKNHKPINNVYVDYSVGPEKLEPFYSKQLFLKDGKGKINLPTLESPGFLTVSANVMVDGKKYSNWINLGFSPQLILPVTDMPSDFMNFWRNNIELSKKIDLNAKIKRIDDKCTSKVDVFEVRYNNINPGSYIYGILCIPKSIKKAPAIIYLPGAGVRPYNGQIKMAEKYGYITLQIGIHGIPVTYPQEIYDNLRYGALFGYNAFNLDNRNLYYYKNVYLGCLRAVDFIYSLPEFDGVNIATYGGSQGGALSIVVCSLDKRIKCAVSFYPALSDQLGYLHNRAGGWPHLFKEKTNITNDKINTVKYYDIVNFARNISVPVFCSWGYNDQTCPPTSTFSVYNVISSHKELFLMQETAHWTFDEQHYAAERFVSKYLKR